MPFDFIENFEIQYHYGCGIHFFKKKKITNILLKKKKKKSPLSLNPKVGNFHICFFFFFSLFFFSKHTLDQLGQWTLCCFFQRNKYSGERERDSKFCQVNKLCQCHKVAQFVPQLTHMSRCEWQKNIPTWTHYHSFTINNSPREQVVAQT